MQRATDAKNESFFIDESIEVLEPFNLNRATWDCCNYLIHSWIFNSISKPISQTIIFLENALDVWIYLKERFGKANTIRVSNLRDEINNMKQGSKSAFDYCIEMRGSWEELNSHRLMSSYTCSQQCRCEVMCSKRSFHIEDQIVTCFINDNFYVIKTQVLLMEPLSSTNKITILS